MSIAQTTERTTKRRRVWRTKKQSRSSLPDFVLVRSLASEVLSDGLNKYQLRLNSKLLEELNNSLTRWLGDYETEIVSQLKHVPEHAKEKWLDERAATEDRRNPQDQAVRLVTDFLLQFAQRKLLELKRLRLGNQLFRNTIAKVHTDQERQRVILQYAAELGASQAQLSGDERAFERWFDEEAVTDRFAKKVGSIELLLAFVFEQLSTAVQNVFQLSYRYDNASPDGVEVVDDYETLTERLEGIWNRLNIEAQMSEALSYEGDDRIKVAALKCLGAAIQRLPAVLAAKLLDKRTLVILNRIAIEARADTWVQCQAISALASLSMQHTMPLLLQRLSHPLDGDDMFVRRHVCKMLSGHMLATNERNFQLPSHKNEPSDFVRQAFAKVAFLSTDEESNRQWNEMALNDGSLQVRAAALLVGCEVKCDTITLVDYLQTITRVLEVDDDPFVLRTAMHVVTTVMNDISYLANAEDYQTGEDQVSEFEIKRETIYAFYKQRIRSRLIRLQHTHEQPSVRRWAAQTREQCWALCDEQTREVLKPLRKELYTLPIGQTRKFPRKFFRNLPNEKIGRVFAVLSQADFGYDVHPGRFRVHVTRGPEFGFRLWRLLFEITHSATDKRQALRHTVGRINTAPMRAPSQICGELSETKVPGEPLTIGEDSTWRPFVPLVDDFVSVLNRSWLYPRTTTFHTSQGVTTVTGPRGIHRRIIAAIKLSFKFAAFAAPRNWDNDTYPRQTYIESMRGLGFQVDFREHEALGSDNAVGNNASGAHQTTVAESPNASELPTDAKEHNLLADTNAAPNSDGSNESNLSSADDMGSATEDETVTAFFAHTMCAAPILGITFLETIQKHFLRYADYFGSAFENSIEQLLVFTCGLLAFVFIKHAHANYKFRKARRNIPLSIGGWGTRGKSGTERLKAALIGAIGHGLVSKTTGCEAMFIHADPNGEPLEIPLFRPFDKATIWEQYNLILMASRMNPSVFLWECMALTPSYVDVLSRQWTCDDLATITNTYPDHEDLQGPAGHNVATTISGFVPIKSHLLTTEQQMRPYITESCRLANSTFCGVGWLESGLVTEDVLERFPYKEHPDNVALVATMGEELGIDYDFSLKAMGDYLVPDLGVLKTHPVSTVRTRKIEFTNGMSANERFGCMGNIKRLGFDTQDPWLEPTTWVSGVVNNRADRVPRSKVFAKIIVEDMNADRYFLIGSNLKGLMGFIEEAWEEKAATISLCDQGQPWDTEFALSTLQQSAWDFRQPIEEKHVREQLEAMLTASLSITPEASGTNVDSMIDAWNNPDQLRSQMESAGVPVAFIDSVAKHQQNLLAGLSEYQQLKSAIQKATPQDTVKMEQQLIETLRGWYFRKLVVVEKFEATGEEVVARVVDETPPGYLNRTIGLQNIKGTGLDFVYRFQAWDVCSEACDATLSTQSQVAERGLQTLTSMPAIGQLCQTRIKEVIAAARNSNALRRPDLQVQITQLDTRVQDAMQECASESTSDTSDENEDTTQSSSNLAEWNSWMLDRSEQFADLNDSVKRRETADRIYRDLATQRISRQRAVVELRKINKRQKGGWLGSALKSK